MLDFFLRVQSREGDLFGFGVNCRAVVHILKHSAKRMVHGLAHNVLFVFFFLEGLVNAEA